MLLFLHLSLVATGGTLRLDITVPATQTGVLDVLAARATTVDGLWVASGCGWCLCASSMAGGSGKVSVVMSWSS